MSEVADIYDDLFNYEVNRKTEVYPIHKRLKLAERYPDLVDLIISKVSFSNTDNVFDVGCGTGYTLIKLGKERAVKGKGISLSKKEISFATEQIKQTPLNDQLEFRVADFNDPISGTYDKIIAIESLKHSQYLVKTLDNLIASLNQSGVLIIADDFMHDDDSSLSDLHKEYWNVPGFGSLETIIEYLRLKKLVVRQEDLTSCVPSRSPLRLNIMILAIRFLLVIAPLKYQVNLKTFVGGLLLEKLYNKKKVGYYLIFASKI